METNKLLLTFILGMFLVSFAYAGGLEVIEESKGDIKIDDKIEIIDSYCLVQDGKAMIEKCSKLPIQEKGEAIEVKLEEQKLLVKQDGLYLKDEVTNLEAKIEEKESSSVYIHKWDSKKQAWHVDNLNLEPVSVYLDLPYNSQPYKIMHYDKDDNYVTTFYRGQYEWLPNCVGEECQDSSGIARVYATISAESIGSDIFSIGNASSGWITQGQYAGVFDGVDDYVNVTNMNINYSYGITLSAWINPRLIIGTSQNKIVSTINTTGSYPYFELYIRNSSGTNPEYTSRIQINSSGCDFGLTSLNLDILNNWAMITSSFNGSEELLFINGVKVSNRSLTDSCFSLLNNLESTTNIKRVMLGRHIGTATNFFNGSLKSVTIYNRSLSSAEVLAEYNKFTLNGINNSPVRNSAPNTTGLVAYYPFDDGSVADFSGNNNHGTNFGVLFSPVKYQTITLTSPANYNLTSSSIFTVAQSRWYEMMNLSYAWNFEVYGDVTQSSYDLIDSLSIGSSWISILIVVGFAIIVLQIILKNKFGIDEQELPMQY